ncbi:TRAP transporter substrate-binding protein [Alcaligenes sp. SDU_A2]|uniref:TRAP transporter substrate-binding protein n=1 Tax=Alcaligenes sp. SDU_A2 TaxID=3136634 RepID=UPI00311EC7A6
MLKKININYFFSILLLVALQSIMNVAVAAKEFNVAVSGTKGGGQYVLAKEFSEQLSKLTDGQYTAFLYLNSQLGDEQSTINDAAMGLLDMSVVATNNISPFSPIVGVLSLPYLIKTEEEALKLVQSDFIKNEIVERVAKEAGVRIIGWDFTGFRSITNSKRPIKNLADLQGLVMRVPKSKVLIETWNSWGINPSPLAWSEVYTALQQKVVDGQALPIHDIYNEKLYEYQKYLSKAHYNYLIQPLVISESIYQDQPADIQKKIVEAGTLASLKNFEWGKENKKIAEDMLASKGVEIISDMDESEMERRSVGGVWPKYYDEYGKDVVENILTVLGRNPT